MLLVESAWRGKDDLWEDKVVHCTDEVAGLVEYCKAQKIPTVFWNKEDPYHFDDFIETIKLFDFVFTTDIECISLYAKHLNHKNIFLLPFACQPKIHNPIEKYDRKNAFVFAGAYYKLFPERNSRFSSMIHMLASEGEIDIYDRNYGNEKIVFQFPKEYHRFIRGSLTYNEIDKAYKGYKYAINLNSMTESPTMFSRRVFELMASNTIVLSNYAVGTQVLLGDLIVSTDNAEELKEKVRLMRQEPLYEKKIRLAALRKVMLEHTAQDRMNEIISKVFACNSETYLPHITCLSYVKEQKQIQRLLKVFLSQSYQNKSLLLVCTDGIFPDFEEDETITCITETDCQKAVGHLGDTDYLAGLCSDDYYGKNYLMDLALATRYSNAKIITKGGRYVYDSKRGLKLEKNSHPYQASISAMVRSSIVRKSKVSQLDIVNFAKDIEAELYIEDSILAIDEFNYCRNGMAERLGIDEKTEVDDLQDIDTGASIDDKWTKKQLLIIEHQTRRTKKIKPKLTARIEKQSAWIKKQEKAIEEKTAELEQLKTALSGLSAIRFSHHPVKKIRSYKRLMETYQDLK